MNIHDIIALKEVKAASAKKINNIKRQYAELDNFLNYAKSRISGGYERGGEIVCVRDKEIQNINNARTKVLFEDGSLADLQIPPQSKEIDGLGKLSMTPTTDLASIRALCDKLGFIITPFEYLDKQSYANEQHEIRVLIERFGTWTGTYVLCPITHYSLENHVRAKNPNKQIYAGQHNQVFLSLQMNIPLLRTIIVDLEAVKDRIRNVEARLEAAEQNMKNLARVLQNLQNQIQERQKQIALQRAEEAELRERLEALEASRFAAMDPMMFITTDAADLLTSNTVAFIGPCWGPDFEDIIGTAIDLSKHNGQREKIRNQLIDIYW